MPVGSPLLQGRTAGDITVARPRDDAVQASDLGDPAPLPTRRFSSPHGAPPAVQLLCNGRYAVMVTAAGASHRDGQGSR